MFICLERAVALASRYRWSLFVPAINAVGAVALLVMRNAAAAKLILTFGSLSLLVLFGLMLWLRPWCDVVMALTVLRSNIGQMIGIRVSQ